MASRWRGRRNVPVWRHAEALMSMALLLQLLGAACALVAGPGLGGFRLPEGGEDGIYQGFVDENGEKHVKYLGKANTTSPGPIVNPRGGIGGPGRKLLAIDPGVNCQVIEGGLSALDILDATIGLANHFGSGNYFRLVYSVRAGHAVAYGCDYGNGQTTTSDQIWADSHAINDKCGPDQPGWYGHESWLSSYGRCPGDWSFCA